MVPGAASDRSRAATFAGARPKRIAGDVSQACIARPLDQRAMVAAGAALTEQRSHEMSHTEGYALPVHLQELMGQVGDSAGAARAEGACGPHHPTSLVSPTEAGDATHRRSPPQRPAAFPWSRYDGRATTTDFTSV